MFKTMVIFQSIPSHVYEEYDDIAEYDSVIGSETQMTMSFLSSNKYNASTGAS